MFWKVLDTLARRGVSGSSCAEQGLPNGASERWAHTSSQPSRLAGPVVLATHSWGILVLSPSLGARETPPHTPANWRMSSIYTWLWECVTHGSSAPQSVRTPQGPAPNKEGGKLCPAFSTASET